MGRRRLIITQKELDLITKRFGPQAGYVIFGLLALSLGIALVVVGSTNNSKATGFGIAGIVIGVVLIVLGNILRYRREGLEEAAFRRRQELLLHSNMSDIDKMSGYQFEQLICSLYRKMGYSAHQTKASGDFGADIITQKDHLKYVIQTKRSSNKVSVAAVQEVTAAKAYYFVPSAVLVSNNLFTEPAKKLAQANNVKLIDRFELAKLIIEYVPDSPISEEQPHIAPPKKQNPAPLVEYDNYTLRLQYDNYLYCTIEPHVKKLLLENKIDDAFEYVIEKLQEPRSGANCNSKHFFILRIINDCYRYRTENNNVIDHIIRLCKMDIDLIPKLQNLEEVSMPSLTKLAVIYEKQNRLEDAVAVCDIGINNAFLDDGKPFWHRKSKLLAKIDKLACSKR